MSELWVVGDVHGAYDKLRYMLRAAGLIDAEGSWTGRDAHLVFLGDYLDRGPDGAGVVHLVRALEAQAPQDGGRVTALLGNHEVMFLAAMRFRAQDPVTAWAFTSTGPRTAVLSVTRMDWTPTI
ncbi:metallophosphoesterase [Deinococcus malanensis]|uniref:metallophosphoesterase n=1 Tax=Deinococcus malanensis TaxID=1706855 RepID=UPI0036261632